MKRKLTVFLAMLCSIVILKAQTLLTQNFTGASSMPPSGWTIDAQAGNWAIRQTNTAGGAAPEARLSWTPQFNTTTRLISPIIDLTGISALRIQMKHSIDHYSGAYTVGIATRSGSGAWTNAWTRAGANVTEAIDVAITNNVGVSDFQFCIFFSGSSYNMNYWYIDDIKLYAPKANDAALTQIAVPDYVAIGDQNVTGKLTNFGVSNITQLNLNYQVDGGSVQTTNLTGLNISTGNTYNFTCTPPWTAEAGDKSLKVWVSNLNGTGIDDDLSNDTLTKIIHVATQSLQRIPFFEEFTSSTCAPCASINASTLNPFFNSHTGYTLLKYQMNWPGTGDPYYTAEGGVRKTYYGVSSVPQMQTDGLSTNIQGGQGPVETMFNQRLAKPAFLNIEAAHTIDSVAKTVNLDIDITPYFNGTNFTVYAAVFENTTHNNATTNGETSFKHVMMKMLPDGSGTPVTFVANATNTLNLTTSLNGTHVEEYADLRIVVWVQYNIDKEVFQSAYSVVADPNAPTMATNPSILSFGNQLVGTTSTLKTYTLTGNNLTADVTITAPNGYEISLNGTDFDSTQTVSPVSGSVNQTIHVRFSPTAAQAYNGNISHSSAGANTRNVALTGTGTNPAPTLGATPATLTFSDQPAGTTSTAQSYTLDGANLTANVTVTAPAGFEVSLNGTDFAGSQTITPASGSVNQTIHVRFAPVAVQAYSGNVSNASSGVTTQNVAVSGNGTVGIAEIQKQFVASVFPNPAKDMANIQFSNAIQKLTMDIADVFGKIVATDQFENIKAQDIKTIKIDKFAKGIYFINIKTDKEQSQIRLIIE